MSKSTKIVATISDIRCEVDFLAQLYAEGMNVVRMNSAHIQREGFERIVNNTRAVSPNLAILMDTKGPEIRTTKIEDDSIDLVTGDIVNKHPAVGIVIHVIWAGRRVYRGVVTHQC